MSVPWIVYVNVAAAGFATAGWAWLAVRWLTAHRHIRSVLAGAGAVTTGLIGYAYLWVSWHEFLAAPGWLRYVVPFAVLGPTVYAIFSWVEDQRQLEATVAELNRGSHDEP